MKTTINIAVILSLLAVASCDQNKSGPVEPTANPPSGTTAAAAPVAPATELFSTGGPSTAVKVGEQAELALSIKPGEGFKINKKFDWKLEFHPHDAVDVPTPSVGMDVLKLDDASATIPLAITAKSAGTHTLTATANFSVCNDEKCELIRNKEVTFKLAATDG